MKFMCTFYKHFLFLFKRYLGYAQICYIRLKIARFPGMHVFVEWENSALKIDCFKRVLRPPVLLGH